MLNRNGRFLHRFAQDYTAMHHPLCLTATLQPPAIMLQRLFLAVCLLLTATTLHAQYIKPRNRLALPSEQPMDVMIQLDQTMLESDPAAANGIVVMNAGAIGGLAGGIASEIGEARMRHHLDPVLARLRQEMPSRNYTELLEAALRDKLAGTLQIGDIRILPKPVDGAPTTWTPSANNRRLLQVRARYTMTAGYRDLRISLDARINPPVTPALCRKDDPDFSQTLFYDVPATGIGYFSGPKDMATSWSAMSGEEAASHIEAGLEQLTAMLAWELAHKPKFGRTPGKQFEWRDGQYTTYGSVETEHDGRRWLRLRNGHLASVPVTD